MVLIAQIWIKHHPKMFVYLCWFNWFIIKVYNWMQWGSLFFLLNIISWTCLLGSELKFIFHLKAQLPIFSKSSLRSLGEVLISLITENIEVSSANNLHSLLRPSDKSLIYIKDNKGPGIDPWETPALTAVQNADHSKLLFVFYCVEGLLKCLWYLRLYHLSCHTLSKAFEISRNIPGTSSPLSNAFKISWLIERLWLMQEFFVFLFLSKWCTRDY